MSDINDNRPVFQPREYNVTLRTDGQMNSAILRCIATDFDAGIFGQVAYRISAGNKAGIFRIDRTSGEIYVVQSSQLNRASTYRLNITATDAAGLKSILDALVQITITWQRQRAVSCDRPRYNISIKEDAAQNTFIGNIRDPSDNSSNGKHIFYFTYLNVNQLLH